MVHASGKAIVRHATTGVEYEIDSDELDWDESFDEDEREMGVEVYYTATIDHPDLGQLSWTISEYPIGVENFRETDVGSHTLVRDFRSGGATSPADDDEANADGATGNIDQARVDELVGWFHERYEDPAESLPYITAEGGYQWVEGGPHGAAEVLYDNFSDEDENVIQAAVEEIESDGLTDWARKRDASDYDDTDYEEPAEFEDSREFERLLEQVPSPVPGPRFEHKAAGHIGMAYEPAARADWRRISALVEECRDVCSSLAAALAGSNAYGDLHRLVERYRTCLQSESFSLERLYGVGLRLENERGRIAQSATDGELPPLASAVASQLNSVLQLHGAIIGLSEAGQELIEGNRKYAQATAVTRDLELRAKQLAEAIVSTPGLADEEAREVIASANAGIGKGPDPGRSTGYALAANQNFLAKLFKATEPIALHVALAGLSVSVVGAAAEGAVAVGINAVGGVVADGASVAWTFVLHHLPTIEQYAAAVGGDLSWVTQLVDVIVRLRQRRPPRQSGERR